MKKRLSRFAVLMLVCVYAFILPTTALFAGAEDAKTKALIALDDEWSKAAGAKDVDRVASFYADDADVYPPNEPMVHGRAAAREVWAKYLNAPNYQISWKTTSAGVENNTGWTAGTYEDSFGKGKYLCVWRRGPDGKWMAIKDMWNSDTK